jgi:hypothetical protein
MDAQIVKLLTGRLRICRGEAISVGRHAIVFGRAGPLFLDTIDRLQRYTELRGIETRLLSDGDADVLERDWSDELGTLACISTMRTAMVFATDGQLGIGEHSYRIALRFSCGTSVADQECRTATFFLVCYDATDKADCDVATATLRELSRWRAASLDTTSDESVLRHNQSDGRAIGVLVNVASAQELCCYDAETKRVAQTVSFSCLRVDVGRPKPVNGLCNALLRTALECIDATWNPPRQPRNPALAPPPSQSQDADRTDALCLLVPHWLSTLVLCRQPSVLPVETGEALTDTLVLNADDFAQK